jgi:hypothetical protein
MYPFGPLEFTSVRSTYLVCSNKAVGSVSQPEVQALSSGIKNQGRYHYPYELYTRHPLQYRHVRQLALRVNGQGAVVRERNSSDDCVPPQIRQDLHCTKC